MAGTTGAPYNWPIPDGNDTLRMQWDAIADLAVAIAASLTANTTGKPIAQIRSATAGLGGTITAATWTALPFDTVDKDTVGGLNRARTGGTSDTRWTCPTGYAGTYKVEGTWGPSASVDQAIYGARIVKNGTLIVPASGSLVAASGTATVTPKTKLVVVDLAVGDYLTLESYGSSSFTTRATADGFGTIMTVEKV